MSDDELTMRLRRIYAAIDASQETDLSTVPPEVIATKNFVCVTQDFQGRLSDEHISNLAHQVIHNVANLRDNLIRWANAHGKDPLCVWATFNTSSPVRVIQDLSNNDKHGYPPKNGAGNSGVAPRLTEIGRALRLSANPGQGIAFVLGPAGPRLAGNGSAMVVVTGQVTSKDGRVVGDLYQMGLDAVAAWEELLNEYGVAIDSENAGVT